MPEYTDNLKLFKYNTETDGKEVFSINEAMNHNWDILDKQPGTLKTNQITNCILEAPNGVVTYSGNTITIKKGLKVLTPDGRNADGTLKNIEFTLQDDIVFDNVTYSDEMNIFLQSPGKYNLYSNKVTFQVKTLGERPDINGDDKYACVYVEETNLWYQKDVNLKQYVELRLCPLAVVSTNGTTTTSVTLYNTLSVLNKNDTEFITHQAMPSNKHINLSLQASGANYTAPADGWFQFDARGDYAKFAQMSCGPNKAFHCSVGTGAEVFIKFQAKKNDVVNLIYDTTQLESFRFIYAQGAK